MKKDILLKDYLYYFLIHYSKNFHNFSSGAAIQNINTEILRNTKINLPPIPTQTKTANILSVYDELIDNNQQRIRLLENMAEEIYKEWFVRLRFPNYQNTPFYDKTRKQVPHGTEGALPKGWEKDKLTKIAVVSDGTHDSPKRTENGHYLVTGKNIKEGFINVSDAYFISKEDHIKIQKRSYLNKGDTIFSNIGTVGNTAFIFEKPDYSVKNVIILRPLKLWNSSYIFSLIRSKYTQAVFQMEMSGASQQFISLNYMRNYKVLIPSSSILKRYEQITGKLFQFQYTLFQKNQLLQQTRDLLLPRLMSGKLKMDQLSAEQANLTNLSGQRTEIKALKEQ